MDPIVDPHRDDWEQEAPEQRLARRGQYQTLLHPGMDEKKKSVFEQASSHVPAIILQEDAILHLKGVPRGDDAEEAAKTTTAIDKLRQVRAIHVQRLRILMMACNHGWDLVNVVLTDRKIGEDKEVASAMEKLEKKKKEKEKEKREKEKEDKESRGRGFRGRRSFRDWGERRRYRSRSYSPRRRSRSRDRRSRSRDRRRRDSSPSWQSGSCFTCGSKGHYARSCPKKYGAK